MTDIHISTVCRILDDLGNGLHPVTGAQLPESSAAHERASIRALLNLAKELQPKQYKKRAKRSLEQIHSDNLANNRPINSHKPWSESETSGIVKGYRNGMTIEELASEAGRSSLSIASKLHSANEISKETLSKYERK